MIIRRVFGLGRGVESLRARHAARPIDRWHDARSSFGARSASAIRPTTPKRAGRLADASVEPTDARKATTATSPVAERPSSPARPAQ
jgi:hypothetical protein